MPQQARPSGAPASLFLRQSIAETLATINGRSGDPAITAFWNEVELYVEDALAAICIAAATA